MTAGLQLIDDERVKKVLENLEKEIPLKWDRITTQNNVYTAYGLIENDSFNQPEWFNLIIVANIITLKGNYSTNSGKYVKEISNCLFGKQVKQNTETDIKIPVA